uniref:Putative secreted protein n=1 Tax=Anopheles darlingi TaxID=43151 RepID=A0A2M4D9A5_ANODA
MSFRLAASSVFDSAVLAALNGSQAAIRFTVIPMYSETIQLSEKNLSTISRIRAGCEWSVWAVEKNRQTYSMPAWLASAVERCSGNG